VVLLALADGEPARVVDKLASELRAEGVRTHVDNRFHLSFGRRSVDWELKGVPVRIELGERELAAGQVTMVRRDDRSKRPVPADRAVHVARDLLDEVQRSLHASSLEFRTSHTYRVDNLEELRRRVADGGFFLVSWCGSDACEEAIGEGTGASVRAIVSEDPPTASCLVDGAPARHAALVARAY
jgi:prolyl-tRNA synthetase